MTDAKVIENIVNEYLSERDLFLVNVKVTKGNAITVTIDGDNGVKVENCMEVSKFIESKLNRDEEDFSLTVTSFGLDEYFSLPRQFKKNIGRTIDVIQKDNEKDSGVLESFDGNLLTLVKKKQKEPSIIKYEDVLKAKVVITF